MRIPMKAALVAASVSACVLAACSPSETGSAAQSSTGAAPAAGLHGMKILLTNDDSIQASKPNNSDGLGLYELRRSLCAAGAQVVTIAPWAVQSGRGTAVTNSGVMRSGTVAPPAGHEGDCQGGAPSPVVGLCLGDGPCGPASESATPSDTVRFALRGGLRDIVGWDRPDLVVSGINSGHNVANSVNDSGTVAAALTAIEAELPAVAFSTTSNAERIFDVRNYRATAEWGARFIAGLRSKNLLGQHAFALNVNYPDVTSGKAPQKAVWTSVGTGMLAWHGYEKQADGSYKVGLSVCRDRPECTESRADADVPTVKGLSISVTPLGEDRTFGHEVSAQDRRLLGEVKAYVDKDAPAPVE